MEAVVPSVACVVLSVTTPRSLIVIRSVGAGNAQILFPLLLKQLALFLDHQLAGLKSLRTSYQLQIVVGFAFLSNMPVLPFKPLNTRGLLNVIYS